MASARALRAVVDKLKDSPAFSVPSNAAVPVEPRLAAFASSAQSGSATLSAYDVGVVAIPEEEYDLEAQLFGKPVPRSKSVGGGPSRSGGLKLPVTPAAAAKARQAAQRATTLQSLTASKSQKVAVFSDLDLFDGEGRGHDLVCEKAD